MDDLQKKSLLRLSLLIVILSVAFAGDIRPQMISNTQGKSVENALKQASDFLNSKDFHDVIKNNAEQIRSLEKQGTINLNPTLPQNRQQKLTADSGNDKPSDTSNAAIKPQESSDTFVLFISSSIPIETLRNYASDIHYNNLPVIMALRGFVNSMSKLKPTIDFAMNVLKKDINCQKECENFNVDLQIAPDLFAEHGISKVPALLNQNTSIIVYGDAKLAYLIDQTH